MFNSSTRNYPHDYKSQTFRDYQQKIHTNKYQERGTRDRSMSSEERHSPRDNSRQDNQDRDKNRDSPRIVIQFKPRIVIRGGISKSQIKDHFVFNRIKVNPQYESQLIKELKKYFDSEYGAVSHLSKTSESKPWSLILKLGFQIDSSAVKALKENIDDIKIEINRDQVKISGKPTQVFEVWLQYQDNKKRSKKRNSNSSSRSQDHSRSRNKKTQNRNRKTLRRRGHSSSQSSSSSSSSRSNSKANQQKYHNKSSITRREQVSHDRSGSINCYKKDIRTEYSISKKGHNNSKDRSLQKDFSTRAEVGSSIKGNQNPKVYKSILFWGLPAITSAKRVDQFLQKHRDGCFVSKKELSWKKIEGSEVCKVLSGQFEQTMAQKFLRTQDPMEVDGLPFIAVQADFQDQRGYIEKLSQYQVNIKFPIEVEPYYLMKWLRSCGKVIQIVSNNKFNESGLSDSYNVTFASKQICSQFKRIKKTSKGTQIFAISSVDDFVPIYRQTQKPEQIQKMEAQDQEISQRFSVSPSRNSSPKRSPFSR